MGGTEAELGWFDRITANPNSIRLYVMDLGSVLVFGGIDAIGSYLRFAGYHIPFLEPDRRFLFERVWDFVHSTPMPDVYILLNSHFAAFGVFMSVIMFLLGNRVVKETDVRLVRPKDVFSATFILLFYGMFGAFLVVENIPLTIEHIATMIIMVAILIPGFGKVPDLAWGSLILLEVTVVPRRLVPRWIGRPLRNFTAVALVLAWILVICVVGVIVIDFVGSHAWASYVVGGVGLLSVALSILIITAWVTFK